jgi:hypothetical protein
VRVLQCATDRIWATYTKSIEVSTDRIDLTKGKMFFGVVTRSLTNLMWMPPAHKSLVLALMEAKVHGLQQLMRADSGCLVDILRRDCQNRRGCG